MWSQLRRSIGTPNRWWPKQPCPRRAWSTPPKPARRMKRSKKEVSTTSWCEDPPIERESIGGFHVGPDEGVWAYVALLVPECLAGFQCVLNSFLRFLLATQGFESFALEVEDVLLAHGRA